MQLNLIVEGTLRIPWRAKWIVEQLAQPTDYRKCAT
jgi:hypothetical protein